MAHHSCCGVTFWLYLLIILGLVLFAGLMSGLTLGLMSLGLVDLEVLRKSGTVSDRKHAEKILPVVKNQHLLLCTLLIGNSLAMEALPIFLDSLVNAWSAVLISVTLILLFGEIIPQAVCSRYGLAVGAAMTPVVRVLVILFSPVAYPISMLLDKILGRGHVALFRRAELKTLVNMHGNEAGKGGELTHDETTIIAGALELTEKTAAQAMTPISSVFSLDVNAKLDLETMNLIMAIGHSRIPVYSESPTNIIGLVLVKNLLTLRPQDETPVKNCTIRKIPRVAEAMPLYDILNDFQKGHSHMAVVVKYSKEKADSLYGNGDTKGDQRLSSRRQSASKSLRAVGAYKFLALDIPEGDDRKDGMTENYSPQRRLPEIGVFIDNGGPLPTDIKSGKSTIPLSVSIPVVRINEDGEGGLLHSQRSKKWEHTGTGNVLEIREESLPSFPNDEEVVGIITMEDLIEELLQEEILDETDEYIDVHNKIRVNLLPPGGRSPLSPRKHPLSPAAASPLRLNVLAPLQESPSASPHLTSSGSTGTSVPSTSSPSLTGPSDAHSQPHQNISQNGIVLKHTDLKEPPDR